MKPTYLLLIALLVLLSACDASRLDDQETTFTAELGMPFNATLEGRATFGDDNVTHEYFTEGQQGPRLTLRSHHVESGALHSIFLFHRGHAVQPGSYDLAAPNNPFYYAQYLASDYPQPDMNVRVHFSSGTVTVESVSPDKLVGHFRIEANAMAMYSDEVIRAFLRGEGPLPQLEPLEEPFKISGSFTATPQPR